MEESVLLCTLAKKGRARFGFYNSAKGIFASNDFNVGSKGELKDAFDGFIEGHGRPALKAAAIAAPGWEQNRIQQMPNHGYNIERDWLASILNVQRLHIVNPTVARAMAIPDLVPGDYLTICPGDRSADNLDATRCTVATGPGLGAAILIKDADDQWTAFSGAAGHIDLAAQTEEEFHIIRALHQRLGRACLERAVSFGGVSQIHSILSGRDDCLDFVDIVALARKEDAIALQAIDMCWDWLARAAADIVLVAGARGGVYLSGDLVDALMPWLNNARFTSRFIKSGKISSYLRSVPVNVITSADIDLNGLRTLFN